MICWILFELINLSTDADSANEVCEFNVFKYTSEVMLISFSLGELITLLIVYTSSSSSPDFYLSAFLFSLL